jgi:hypothetical protein
MANHEKTYEETADTGYGSLEKPKRTIATRIIDSFKRDPNAHASSKAQIEAGRKNFDVETAAAATAESPLARKLKGRHLQMIAIGGSIGMFEYGLSERIGIDQVAQVRVYSSVPEAHFQKEDRPRS